MKELHRSRIDIDNVEEYIDENAKRISQYVYLGAKVSKDDVQRIRTFKKKIPKLIEFYRRARPLLDIKEISNELQIISALQAIILDDSSEIFDYTFYGYQKNSAHHKERVQAALKNDDYVHQALQIYWVRKIVDRWYANLGRYKERIELRKLERACDSILIEILSKPSLDEMWETHNYYAERVDDGLITTEQQIQAAKTFENYLDYKGFEYIDAFYLIRYAFLYPPEIEKTYKVLTGMIDMAIGDQDPCIQMEMEVTSANGNDKLKVNFTLDFDYKRNECIMSDFNTIMLDPDQ